MKENQQDQQKHAKPNGGISSPKGILLVIHNHLYVIQIENIQTQNIFHTVFLDIYYAICLFVYVVLLLFPVPGSSLVDLSKRTRGRPSTRTPVTESIQVC